MAAIKRWNGSAWEETYPKTTAGNIVATGTPSASTFLRGDGAWATTPQGTVTSVGLSLPTSVFTGTGSVTTSGTLTRTFANQNANTIFAGPTTGLPGVPAFRTLVADDLPAHTHSIANVTGLQTALDGKAATSHTHLSADITDLKSNLKFLYIYGKAQSAITKGQAVQFAGVQGDHILMKPAVPSEINANPDYFIGIAEATLATDAFGYILTQGELTGLNTSGYTAGNILWFASAGSTAGALTATEPTGVNAKIQVASVNRVNAGDGILFVRVNFVGTEIEDIVASGTPGATTFLRGDGSWSTTGDVVGPASSVTARIATFNGTTGKLIQDSGTLISDLATSTHTHGDISNAGAIATTAVTPASNDYIIISDSTASNVLKRGILINSTVPDGTFLQNNGTFARPRPLRNISNFTAPIASNGTTGVTLNVTETIAIGNEYAIEVSDDATSTNNRMLLFWTQQTSSSTSAAAGQTFTFTARTISTTTTITYKFVVYRSGATSFNIINAYTHTLGTGSSHPIATTTAIRAWRIFRVGG